MVYNFLIILSKKSPTLINLKAIQILKFLEICIHG